MTTVELLRSAARKLGPERCEQALRSMHGEPNHTYCDCVLGHAFGNPQSIEQYIATPHADNLITVAMRGPGRILSTAARLLGLTEDEAMLVSVIHYRGRCEPRYELLRAILTEEASKIARESGILNSGR